MYVYMYESYLNLKFKKSKVHKNVCSFIIKHLKWVVPEQPKKGELGLAEQGRQLVLSRADLLRPGRQLVPLPPSSRTMLTSESCAKFHELTQSFSQGRQGHRPPQAPANLLQSVMFSGLMTLMISRGNLEKTRKHKPEGEYCGSCMLLISHTQETGPAPRALQLPGGPHTYPSSVAPETRVPSLCRCPQRSLGSCQQFSPSLRTRTGA